MNTLELGSIYACALFRSPNNVDDEGIWTQHTVSIPV